LYPVFPIINKECLLTLLQLGKYPRYLYLFLAALSAAVIVQLNVVDLRNLEA
ncbi:hypothetical protein DER44DRAFT_680262, partial [Fusarium oxysporum]